MLSAEPSVKVDKQFKATESGFFGLSTSFQDVYQRKITINPAQNTANGGLAAQSIDTNFDKSTSYSVLTKLNNDFTEKMSTTQYYGLIDILSEIGGIGALCVILLSIMSVATVLYYTLSFVNMIRRKDQLKWKQTQVKKMLRWKDTLQQDMIDKYGKLTDEN